MPITGVVLFFLAPGIEASPDGTAAALFVPLLFLSCLASPIAGLLLGLFGTIQKSNRRGLAIAGTVLNILWAAALFWVYSEAMIIVHSI